jgi:DNA-binding beta-propeller fold protein YncE
LHRWPHLLLGFIIATGSNCLTAAEPANGILQLQQTIPLSNVEGRIDHFDFDAAHERLFVCALGNNTVEVVDLRKGERVHTISELGAPEGLAYLPGLERLFVANDKGGLCHIYDTKSWQLVGTVDLHDDADNVRYDAIHQEVLVGFGNGGIAVIKPDDGKQKGSIKLKAHPEAFELEKQGRRMFVNVPETGEVAVIDRDKNEVIASWKLAGASANFPMALDEASHRLLVGCRRPAKLVVLNTDSGASVTTLDISGDADEIFYDAKRRRVYAVCGEGFIDVIEQTDADHYRRTATIPTAAGARTGLFAPESDDLFIGVPHHGAQRGEIRRYKVR